EGERRERSLFVEPRVRMLIQFPSVAALELRPFWHVVLGPTAQRIAGRDIFKPVAEVQRFLRDPARPPPVDQKARSMRLVMLVHPWSSIRIKIVGRRLAKSGLPISRWL